MNAAIALSEGRVASQIWNQEQYHNLLAYLHGDNPPKHFGFSMVPRDDHQFIFRHNKRLLIDAAISSTWKSLCMETERPYSLVLLPPANRESVWVVWDFDFHDQPSDALNADMLRNLLIFTRQAEELKQEGIFHLVEHSGNGWHFWLIGDKPRKEKEWKVIRRSVENAASFTCNPEFLPSFGGAGKGCRAPGSSNPKTWHVTREDWQHNLIFNHTIPIELVQLKRRISLSLSCTGGTEEAENRNSFEHHSIELSTKWQITKAHERHNRMLRMVGEGCFQFSKAVLKKAATRLHQEASPSCATSMHEHLADFDLVYAGAWEKLVLPRLSDQERQQFEAFRLQTERDVFITCQNHARLKGGTFFFSTTFVGECVGLSFGRVKQLRDLFIKLKIIEKLPGGYSPGHRAYSFRWLLPMRKMQS